MVTTTTMTASPENERIPREILILFKTHLDLGFTDLAGDVFRRYMDSYIPQALALAKQTRNSPYRFRWTVGSWLFEQYRRVEGDTPELQEAVLRAGTLEDVAEIALAEEDLPVVTSEIGDTWIHGTGTDPAKTSAFRGLLRLAEELPEEDRGPVYEALLPVPEHTWGLDEKTHLSATYPVDLRLGEHENFIREDFWEARKEPRYRLMECSWEEQREYLRDGCAAFPESFRPRAERVFAETRREPASREGTEAVLPGEKAAFGEFTAAADARGALVSLEWKGLRWADEDHPLFRFLYEVFSQKEFDRFREQYVVSGEEWAIEDFGKIGMEKANDRYRAYSLRNVEIRRSKDSLIITGEIDKESLERFGGAESYELILTFRENQILGDFAWFGKKASRVAEACWLGFLPNAPLKDVHKLGTWLDPMDVVPGGNRQMHVTQAGVRWEGLTLRGIDTGLISIGPPPLLNFSRTLPDLRGGVWFNLHNNVWGTNFPMWYDQDARFRFALDFTAREK